jgi:anthranilate synthase component 1
VLPRFKAFMQAFQVDSDGEYGFLSNGLFGYVCYDGVEHFEDIVLEAERDPAREIPQLRYSLYQFIIAINHYNDEMYLVQNRCTPGSAEHDAGDLERLQYEIEHSTSRPTASGASARRARISRTPSMPR